jgi:hypothetical protein
VEYYTNIEVSKTTQLDQTITVFDIEIKENLQQKGGAASSSSSPSPSASSSASSSASASTSTISLTQYYNKRNNTVLGQQPNDSDVTLEQGFNAVFAICDNIHDFSKELGKPQIIEDYNKNKEYVHIMNNLNITDYIKYIHPFKNLAITVQDESDYSCISRTCSSKPPSSVSDSGNTPMSETDYDQCYAFNCINKEHQIQVGKWENVFLSQFYYSVLSVFDLQFIHKLNIRNKDHAIKFANYLKKQGYEKYFYDMAICSSDQTGKYYNFDLLKNTLKENGIEKNNTIAKWWDPSSGGNYIENQLENFNKVLKDEVMQPLSGFTSFNKIESITELLVSDNRHIAIPNNCYTINNCIDEMNKLEQKTGNKRKINQMTETDKLLYYDMKRSGDHGQIMYLKHWNSQGNTKNFLVTGDSMCATKAIFEKVPVLFKKFHYEAGKTPIVDLYFYDPPGGNFTREYLIKKNKIFFADISNDLLINQKLEQKCVITLNENKKLTYSFETDDNVNLEDNYKYMVNIINAYEYFVHEATQDGVRYFVYLLKDALDKVTKTYDVEKIRKEEIENLHKIADDQKIKANVNTSVNRNYTKRQQTYHFNENQKQYDILLKEAVITADTNRIINSKIFVSNMRVLNNVLKNIVDRYKNKFLEGIKLIDNDSDSDSVNILDHVKSKISDYSNVIINTSFELGSDTEIKTFIPEEELLYIEINEKINEILKFESPTLTPEQVAPTPESVAPTPTPSTPIPESVAPIPESVAPTPESVAPTPSTPTPSTPTPSTPTPTPESVAPTPESVAPTPESVATTGRFSMRNILNIIFGRKNN